MINDNMPKEKKLEISSDLNDLLSKLLKLHPYQRIGVNEALDHVD